MHLFLIKVYKYYTSLYSLLVLMFTLHSFKYDFSIHKLLL